MTLIATLMASPLSRDLDPALVDAACAALQAESQSWLAKGIACDIRLTDTTSGERAEEILAPFLAGKNIDHAIQEESTRRKKVLITDMDSTMIDQECIDELAAEVGLKDKVAAITVRAMNGEIEFEPSVHERVALLKGLPASVVDAIVSKRITLASGGTTLVKTMKANGGYTALVSGGFKLFTEKIATMIGFDENRGNMLEVRDGQLTGKVCLPVLGAGAKVDAMNDIARQKSLSPLDFIAVGDGANDLAMLKLAGSGVALHAKPAVAAEADIKISHCDLTALLYLQGYKADEFHKS